ncbi:sigma-54 dependent transcriptional regulator [Aestuariibacter sp. AA17]|uniref:Sigma-54 dependent transcriptional regulator n=1 Tax=Fluctibacter corallii TaxID=2984329 RepID=A0ABT3A5J2_9ALTE|nr:sigma-54 dependent transcriptional regulator [Aestuariibacter sp. AA17]MCV2883824.1 sigma-54 dependent transcriptional regulator [Aestuariibacter sp. AA17]
MRPRIVICVGDSKINEALSSMKVLSSFDKVYGDPEDPEFPRLLDESVHLAIVEVNATSRKRLKDLQNTPHFSDIEFLFLSDGTPDENLDKIMFSGAGFHFRTPYDFGQIETTLDDFYASLETTTTRSVSAVTSNLDQFGLLVGSSKSMHKVYRLLRKVAQSDVNVFIVGESGCGKELVANTLHLVSERHEKPFVAINCGALSPELVDSELFGHVKGAFTGAHRDHEGVFSQAEGGTLFLDEVTEMPLDHQIKLLRVLETGEYRPVGSNQVKIANVRVVSATNRDPQEAIRDNIFRHDLYFRLAQFPVHIPPLRKRGKDIEGLARHFLAYRNAEEKTNKCIDAAAIEKINAHSWPGNVRELKYAIERAFLLCDEVIEPGHLLLETADSDTDNTQLQEDNIPSGVPLFDLEKQVILKTLEDNKGNKTDTATQLGISVKTLYNKLEKYQQE